MADAGTGTKIDEALTRRVANLARLELTDEEVKIFTQQIAGILKYVDQLQELDVSQVEPLTHPMAHPSESPTSLREDEVVVFESVAAMLLDGESHEGGYQRGYKVPQII